MLDPFEHNSHTHWIPFADILAGILSIFLVVAVLLTFHLTVASKTKDEDIKSPGSIMVEVYWKEDVDVDLWMRSPGDVPIGYSRKQGRYVDLLRDDLGRAFEATGGMHHENAFSRKTPTGEWVVNLHMYSMHDPKAHFPIDAEVSISFQNDAEKGGVTKMIKTTVHLEHEGQEVTVARFKIDQDGQLAPGSINHDPTPLRGQ